MQGDRCPYFLGLLSQGPAPSCCRYGVICVLQLHGSQKGADICDPPGHNQELLFRAARLIIGMNQRAGNIGCALPSALRPRSYTGTISSNELGDSQSGNFPVADEEDVVAVSFGMLVCLFMSCTKCFQGVDMDWILQVDESCSITLLDGRAGLACCRYRAAIYSFISVSN